MDQTIVITVVVQYPTAEPSLTPSITATPTATNTPDGSYIYATVAAPGEMTGQPVVFRYEMDAGQGAMSFLLMGILLFLVVLVIVVYRRNRRA